MKPSIAYIDTSLALFAITDVPSKDIVIDWMEQLEQPLVSSRLFRTEVIRAMRRDNRSLDDAAPLLERVQLLQITEPILKHAEGIKAHTKALDAIHLGTAMAIEDSVVFATHDNRMKSIANNLGFKVLDPLSE